MLFYSLPRNYNWDISFLIIKTKSAHFFVLEMASLLNATFLAVFNIICISCLKQIIFVLWLKNKKYFFSFWTLKMVTRTKMSFYHNIHQLAKKLLLHAERRSRLTYNYFCCVFQPAFMCYVHPKASWNTFSEGLQTFLYLTFNVFFNWKGEKRCQNCEKHTFFIFFA